MVQDLPVFEDIPSIQMERADSSRAGKILSCLWEKIFPAHWVVKVAQ